MCLINENYAGCINVIKGLHQYVPHGENEDGTGGKYQEQGIVCDQLIGEICKWPFSYCKWIYRKGTL